MQADNILSGVSLTALTQMLNPEESCQACVFSATAPSTEYVPRSVNPDAGQPQLIGWYHIGEPTLQCARRDLAQCLEREGPTGPYGSGEGLVCRSDTLCCHDHVKVDTNTF